MEKRKGYALAFLQTCYLNDDDEGDESSESSESENEDYEQKEDGSRRAKTREIASKKARRSLEKLPEKETTCLPIPKGIMSMFDDTQVEPNVCQDGRVRSFEHFPGNWALHIYTSFPGSEALGEMIESLLKSLPPKVSSSMHRFPLDDLHVSLSRTVPIRHYWIEPITEQLKGAVQRTKRFHCTINNVQLYVNDEKTRSFLGLTLSTGQDELKGLTTIVDKIFAEFSLPSYYEKPSFHVSVAWCLGDVFKQISLTQQKQLQETFESRVTNPDLFLFNVEEIKCKIGNKLFCYELI